MARSGDTIGRRSRRRRGSARTSAARQELLRSRRPQAALLAHGLAVARSVSIAPTRERPGLYLPYGKVVVGVENAQMGWFNANLTSPPPLPSGARRTHPGNADREQTTRARARGFGGVAASSPRGSCDREETAERAQAHRLDRESEGETLRPDSVIEDERGCAVVATGRPGRPLPSRNNVTTSEIR